MRSCCLHFTSDSNKKKIRINLVSLFFQTFKRWLKKKKKNEKIEDAKTTQILNNF